MLTMKMNRYVLLFLILTLAACNEREFQTYHGGRFISFETDYRKDSVLTTFFFVPEESEIEVALPVQLAGLPLEEDEKFTISVVEEETTADASNYEIQPEYTFSAGQATDTVVVKLLKSDLLNAGRVKLVLTVDASETLQLGQTELRKAKIVFSNLADQPSWWKDEIEEIYLGPFTAKKYQTFIIAVGAENADLSDKESMEIWDLARQFKYYLRAQEEAGNPILDEDDKPMKVSVIG